MTCPRCGSPHINIYPITEIKSKNRGCLGWIGWILLAILTCGLIIIIPLLTNTKTKSKTRTMAICQNCGKRWRL